MHTHRQTYTESYDNDTINTEQEEWTQEQRQKLYDISTWLQPNTSGQDNYDKKPAKFLL